VSNNAVGTNLSSTVYVYATNYNVLRIMSGMGGLNLRMLIRLIRAKKQYATVKRPLTVENHLSRRRNLFRNPRLTASNSYFL